MLLAQHMPRWDSANRRQLLLVVHTVIELSIQVTYLNVSPSVFKLFLSSQFKKKNLWFTLASIFSWQCSSCSKSISLFFEECHSDYYLGWQNTTEIGSRLLHSLRFIPSASKWDLGFAQTKTKNQSTDHHQTKCHPVFLLRHTSTPDDLSAEPGVHSLRCLPPFLRGHGASWAELLSASGAHFLCVV